MTETSGCVEVNVNVQVQQKQCHETDKCGQRNCTSSVRNISSCLKHMENIADCEFTEVQISLLK